MTLDLVVRYVLIPLLGTWALYRIIRELLDYRRGQW